MDLGVKNHGQFLEKASALRKEDKSDLSEPTTQMRLNSELKSYAELNRT